MSYYTSLRLDMVTDFTKIAVIVCVFVVAREFRPIEPFLTAYLTQPPLNLTTTEVNERVYPMGTYASFTWVVIIFIVTDYLRYKPIIVLDGLAGILTYGLLLGKPSLLLINIEQIFYGFFYASDVACATYLYAKMADSSLYQRITGYVRASSLIGRFTNGVFSQSMVSFKLLKLNQLMYASIAGMIFVTAWAFMIPSISHSIYFHKKESTKSTGSGDEKTSSNQMSVRTEKLNAVGARLWDDFKTAYKNFYVLKWSIWWAFGLSGCYFVETYAQVLWQCIAVENNSVQYLFNGAVESVSTLLSATSVYLVSKTRFDWPKYGDWVLGSVTILLSSLLLYLFMSANLWLAYVAYVTFEILFHTLFTIVQSEVAQHLRKDSFVLIFGFNNFVALSFSSVLTYVMIEGKLEILNFATRQQFLFFSTYFCVIAMLGFCKALIGSCRTNVIELNPESTST